MNDNDTSKNLYIKVYKKLRKLKEKKVKRQKINDF